MQRPRVVLGVAGGIAAYKAVELLRQLTESGHDVRVIPTASALRFVGEPTWAALSGQPVTDSAWEDVHNVPHVRIGQQADLLVVAPATADLLAKAAHGLADDLLTNTLLTARCPVLMAPAMHTEMWEHPATRANVALLRDRGIVVLEPGEGRLTGADSGKGRLAEPAEIARICRRLLERGHRQPDLAGRRLLVTAGGTREHLDPVRFVGNRSSGRQGYAFARAAAARGADVVLVAANVSLPDPAGVTVVRVVSAEELREAVVKRASDSAVVVMAAAVADYRPAVRLAAKHKKTGSLTVELVATTDVLAELGASRTDGQVLVGFAAETDDVLANGRAKLARKGCDLLVVNEVGEAGHPTGFEGESNAATVLGADGSAHEIPLGSKEALADAVLDLVVARLVPRSGTPG
ncbi:MAG: bifunctional phosphopantothenoylcysteine decarboxylase/phosphopantothenate--cysteine ligase CoaBC [Actinomycetota bacterium]|nr:bifunctional phosphopantothenoylcysteine decarboxylase/phosphopantothenate--cysteine ligase CoaBC [Actinomycetota bacterium]